MWSNVKDDVAPFVYREPGAASKEPDAADSLRSVQTPAESTAPPVHTEQETVTRERRGYERGLEEGEKRAHAHLSQAIVHAQGLSSAIAAEFERERGLFFQRVESEVVRLALAIARKILHRESQMDPLLLAAVARVALEQVASGCVVRLCVNPSQIEAWRDFFAAQASLNLRLEWMGDASLDPAQCRLETTVGSTSLSLEDQLGEIQQGFFDLLAEKGA